MKLKLPGLFESYLGFHYKEKFDSACKVSPLCQTNTCQSLIRYFVNTLVSRYRVTIGFGLRGEGGKAGLKGSLMSGYMNLVVQRQLLPSFYFVV